LSSDEEANFFDVDENSRNVKSSNTGSSGAEKPQRREMDDWRNGVLVLVSVRLGLKKVPKNYWQPIK